MKNLPINFNLRITKESGFTLLELMMVVVILSVLSIIAVVSYSKYIQKSRMQDAVAFLMDIKLKQESYFQIYSQYVDTAPSEDNLYPDPFAPDALPAPWLIKCPEMQDIYPGWCALGAKPTGALDEKGLYTTTYYRYVSIGWQPGDQAPPAEYIRDPTRRWWFARAKTFLDKNGSKELELRLSSEVPVVMEDWPE